MMKLAILLVVATVAKQAYGDEPEAIVGGKDAMPGQFRCQVSLQVDDFHMCGGCLINKTHVVTAAHCVDDPDYVNTMTVVTGTINWKGGERHKIKYIRPHPGYTGNEEDALANDIAIITLKWPIEVNAYQGPIPLADLDYATGNYRGTVSGWGKTSENSRSASLYLQWMETNVLSTERCMSEHTDPQTTVRHICALEKSGKGICNGDSGGPLIVNGQLCGVVSWGVPCAMGISDVFTNIYHYLPFIKES
ncbi:Chymotrypsin-1 [Harpegnathos saltator]|uniref:Chymotrypsin-1 n=2 Tax=Harpegnathos saltator TaxID=610380 RepID=E2B505_HARSA|nr:Chymotrypsin-1 [Harpegnathos saltator]